MMMRNILFFMLLCSAACKSQSKWEGGKISKPGVYEYGGLRIFVLDQNYTLEYFMLNAKGDTLISRDGHFSSFQRWTLHLDRDQNLWVFSSDIGDACWEKDFRSEKYLKKEFVGLISKDSVPGEVYNTLKQFHPYSNQK